MNKHWMPLAWAALTFAAGCMPPPPAPPRGGERQSQYGPADGPGDERPRPARAESDRPAAPAGRQAEVSFDTPRDGEFARFVVRTAGGLVRKVAVGIERKATMRVEVAEAVAPDDLLPLTKSLVAGARKDFPDKPFTLSVYDPHGEPVLKAHYRPGHGVDYEVARSEGGRDARTGGDGRANRPEAGHTQGTPLPQAGTTEKDRHFAEWALRTAPRYLRYVQADLERRGRLWVGVTREVRPEDLKDLTGSLLEGARKEFPRRELIATVFDPEGERVGRATLAADGRVHWSH